MKMTPYFEKINSVCGDFSFDLKTVPAAGPGSGPPFTIFKKFPQLFFILFFAFFAVFDQNSPHGHPYVFPAKNSIVCVRVAIPVSHVFARLVRQLKRAGSVFRSKLESQHIEFIF